MSQIIGLTVLTRGRIRPVLNIIYIFEFKLTVISKINCCLNNIKTSKPTNEKKSNIINNSNYYNF